MTGAPLVAKQVSVPILVRVKPGALGRIGIYLERLGIQRPLLLHSAGLPDAFLRVVVDAVGARLPCFPVGAIDRDAVAELSAQLQQLHGSADGILGLGGGRALDAAKVIAAAASLPYVAVPTSLSNDGFASPGASLVEGGRRISVPARMPQGVVVDTEVCAGAPQLLWLSGVGDLVAKLTAVQDWKLAYHARGVPIEDLAALLSDATVFQLIGRPVPDRDGMRLLATALLLNGVAMEMAGSSRPASGSEHLISHALDRVSSREHLHGLQVGVATYVVSHLQARTRWPRRDGPGNALREEVAAAQAQRIGEVLGVTGFWRAIRERPFARSEFLEAVRLAPTVKRDFFTVLDTRDCVPEVEELLVSDARLAGCFE